MTYSTTLTSKHWPLYQNQLRRLINRAWKIWHERKENGHPITYKRAASLALLGEEKDDGWLFEVPNDAIKHFSIDQIVEGMKAQQEKIKRESIERKLAQARQRSFSF